MTAAHHQRIHFVLPGSVLGSLIVLRGLFGIHKGNRHVLMLLVFLISIHLGQRRLVDPKVTLEVELRLVFIPMLSRVVKGLTASLLDIRVSGAGFVQIKGASTESTGLLQVVNYVPKLTPASASQKCVKFLLNGERVVGRRDIAVVAILVRSFKL